MNDFGAGCVPYSAAGYRAVHTHTRELLPLRAAVITKLVVDS